VKILSLKNLKITHDRNKFIEKYSFNKRFWFDFPDDRPHCDDDLLFFLLPVYGKITSLFFDKKTEKNILIKIRVLWDKYSQDLGAKSTPKEIIMHIMNFFMLRIYKKK